MSYSNAQKVIEQSAADAKVKAKNQSLKSSFENGNRHASMAWFGFVGLQAQSESLLNRGLSSS
jgi:hypothetical protein